jgi:hypothetical protein
LDELFPHHYKHFAPPGLGPQNPLAPVILKDRQPTVGANFSFTLRFNLL